MANKAVMKIGDVKLTELEYRFCLEYIVDFDGAKAMRRAGSKSKRPDVRAAQLLADERVKQAIAVLRREEVKHSKIDKAEVISQLADTARRDAKLLFDKHGILILNHSLLRKKGVTKLSGQTIHDLPDALTQSIDGVKQKCHAKEDDDGNLLVEVQTELKLVGKASVWDMLMKHFGGYVPDTQTQVNVGIQMPPGWYEPGQGVEDEVQRQLEEG